MIELFTTYISNIKNIPSDVTKIFVCRWLPPSIKLNDSIHLLKLAPSEMLLKKYKSGSISFNDFEREFISELDDRKLNLSNVKGISKMCFICYEKDSDCHRYILGRYFSEKDNNFIYRGEL